MNSYRDSEADVHVATRALLLRASIEISGRDLDRANASAIAQCCGEQVFLPWTPNLEPNEILEATAMARRLGLLPVPHVCARRIADESGGRALLDGLARAGAEAVLLVGGDVSEPRGPYRSSLELLRSGALQAAGIRRLAVAGYPEGHPAIADEVLRENLELKLEYARREGLDAFIVTQFCFDAEAIVAWAHGLRARGITVPIRAGIAGPASLARLLQLALRCGVGNSIRALKGRMASMMRLVAVHEPEELIRDLAAGVLAAPGVEPLALHLFAFGGLEATTRWIARAPGGQAARPAVAGGDGVISGP